MRKEMEKLLHKYFSEIYGCGLWFMHDMERDTTFSIFLNPDRGCIGCGYREREGAD